MNLLNISTLFVILMLCLGRVSSNFQFEVDEIFIKTNQAKCEVDNKFLSVAIDLHFIFNHNLDKLIQNKVFMSLVKGLWPAYLRIGGTAADLVLFDDSTTNAKQTENFSSVSEMETLSWSNSKICMKHDWPVLHLSTDLWLTINNLAKAAKFNLIFDLNVLTRTQSGEWDHTNALKLIRFSHKKKLILDWQLGNEPNSFCHVFGKKVSPKQLAFDFGTLSTLLAKFPLYQNSKILGPDITAPRGPKKRQISTLHYLDRFLSKAKTSITGVTWHQYYINGRNATKEEFMNPSILENLRQEISDVKSVVSKNINENFPIWISETASAFGGGAQHLSDRFVAGFMWLDKLGMSAKYNISVVVRQSLIGNHYGLINEKQLTPTPNFWISYLFKNVVGKTVLELESTLHSSLIRLYAHCGKKSRTHRKRVVIFGMNLSSADYRGKIVMADRNQYKSYQVHQYLLTSINSDVTSEVILLNGKVLEMTGSEELPILTPVRLQTDTIYLPPRSIAFYIVHDLAAPACK